MNLILRGSVWRSCQKDPSGTEGCCPTNRGPSSRCPSWRLLSRWPRSVSCAPSFTRYSKVCVLQTIWTLRGVCRKASGFTLRLKTSITFVNSSLIFLWILLLLYNMCSTSCSTLCCQFPNNLSSLFKVHMFNKFSLTV